MALYFLLFFEWEILVKLCNVRNLLQLVGVALNLLFEVLNALCNTFGNFEIVLHLLHGTANLGLLQRILGKSLVRLLKLADLILLQINLCHLSMIVGQLLIIIIVRWLLIFLQFIDWRFTLLFVIVGRLLIDGTIFLRKSLLLLLSITLLGEVHRLLLLLKLDHLLRRLLIIIHLIHLSVIGALVGCDHLWRHPTTKLVIQKLHLLLAKVKFLHLVLHAVGRLFDLLWLLLHYLLLRCLFWHHLLSGRPLRAWHERGQLLRSLLKLHLL